MTDAASARPWLLRLAPPRLRQTLYYRLFSGAGRVADALWRASPLSFARGVTMSLKPGDVSHRCIALTGFYELNASRLAVRLARRGGLLVDVGANYGYYSLLWAAARPNNRVLAFEASPRNFPALRRNVEANGFDERIECRDEAVGKENCTMTFDPGPEEQTGWGGFAAGSDGGVAVRVRPLDAVLADSAEPVELLKIDTEGADTWVLAGASGLLKAGRIKNILYEQYPSRMKKLGVPAGEAETMLRSFGYGVRPLGGDEWFAWK
jgi:FkbM family methyltransferase